MPERPKFIQQKSSDELVRQIDGNSRYMEELISQPIIPPSFRDIHLLGLMSETDVKKQFGTKRYEILANLIRADLQGQELPYEKQEEYTRWLQVLNNVDRYIDSHHSSENNRTLYPKQMEVFESLGSFLANGGSEGYFKLPTAFGKTVIFTEFVKAANLRTLIVVPTLEVLDQTGTTFNRLAPEIEVGKVYQGERKFGEKTTVITYASLLRWLDERIPLDDILNFRPYDIELLILDEAHHALGDKTALAISQFPEAIKLGFTATPFYSPQRHLGQLLERLIFSISIKEAVLDGSLSPFRVWIAQTNIDISSVNYNSETGDYNQQQLEKVVNVASRNKAAVDLYQQYFSGESAVVNCVLVKHAQEVARLFQENGVRAEAVWGDMRSSQRLKIIEAFRNGEIEILCNEKLLIEGFDAPNASICINLKPTLSAVVAEQRGGRVLRLNPENPYKEAVIVDFVDSQKGTYNQVTFAEVAETAGISRNLEKEGSISFLRNGTTYRLRRRLIPSIINLDELKVTTDISEVMRVVSYSKQRGNLVGLPEGQVLVELKNLGTEYGLNRRAVEGQLEKLCRRYPEYFVKRGKGRATSTTSEGLILLRKALGKLSERTLRDSGEWVKINNIEWYTKYSLSKRTFGRYLNILRKAYPESFKTEFGIGTFTTMEGMTILCNYIDTPTQIDTPSEYEELSMIKLAREFHLGEKTVKIYFNALMDKFPDKIIKRGNSQAALATLEIVVRLKDYLRRVRTGEKDILQNY